jgi:crotonobetainyl-CoA:carnitine CoA-transferase CaiB-like acyl-CoA transferase
MPSRISPWGIYDVFSVAAGEQIFLAVVSDTQWALFCDAFALADLKADVRLGSNNLRVLARHWLIPLLGERLAAHRASEIAAVFEAAGLPYAPITRPEDLFDDPHLRATGGLAPLTLPDGRETLTPLLPLTLAGERLALRRNPPRLGEHTDAILASLGYGDEMIAALRADGVIGPASFQHP